MADLRRRIRSVSLPGREDLTVRNAFKFGSIGLFFGLLVLLVTLSVTADIVFLGILAGVAVSQMLYIVLPMERIRMRARALYTGEAGEDAYEELEDRGGGLR